MNGGRAGRSAVTRSAAGAALLAAAFACARQEAPRGGEPDRTPPAVIAVTPEANSVTQDLRTTIRIQFNERISERPTGGLMADAVLVSPLTVDARTRHRGTALEVEIPEGLRPDVVYRITVLPVIRDLFGNGMREPFEFVFSTGGELTPSVVAGLVVDRTTGRPTREVLVEAFPPDTAGGPPIYVARTDSAGLYGLRYLPAGSYDLIGFLDRDRSRTPDPFEVQGRLNRQVGTADTVLDANFAILEPDTTGPRLTRGEVPEKTLIRLIFDDFIDPDESLVMTGATIVRTEGQGPVPEVRQLVHEDVLVALRREAAAAPPDTGAAAAGPPRPQAAPLSFVGRAQGADSTYLGLLGLKLPSHVIYAELSDSLDYDVDYVIRIQGAVNLSGARAGIDSIRVTRGDRPTPPPSPPPPPERR